MLALLALVLFPVAANANSGESVYEPEVPTVESTPKTTPHKNSHPHSSETPAEAHGSAAEESGSGEPTEETGMESEGESHKKKTGVVPSEGGNNNPPKSGGEGGNSSGPGKSEVGVGEHKAVEKSQSGKPVSSTSSSSPVVPILIAVIVLAAISIGVVLYRQRKSGQDPDGRGSVSSSNAS